MEVDKLIVVQIIDQAVNYIKKDEIHNICGAIEAALNTMKLSDELYYVYHHYILIEKLEKYKPKEPEKWLNYWYNGYWYPFDANSKTIRLSILSKLKKEIENGKSIK